MKSSTDSQTSESQVSRSDWLVLIPTQFEFESVQKQLPSGFLPKVEVCGFGPIVPAARTVQLIHAHRPAKVLLLGIAGSYSNRVAMGTALPFYQAACYGVGVGNGASFQTAEMMGWQHWLGRSSTESIGDVIELSVPRVFQSTKTELSSGAVNIPDSMLVTATSAASHSADVEHRLQIFPDALAEDMEGFAVAVACKLCAVPLFVVRGISNLAGDRNKANWKILEALTAAVELSQLIIKAEQ